MKKCNDKIDTVEKKMLHIRIKDIDFKYDPNASQKTLEGVSFEIPEGKVTAIVGCLLYTSEVIGSISKFF